MKLLHLVELLTLSGVYIYHFVTFISNPYLLYKHYFIRATQPVSVRDYYPWFQDRVTVVTVICPNAPTFTGPRNALIAFLAWSGQRSWHCLLWPEGSSVHPTTPHLWAAFLPSTQSKLPVCWAGLGLVLSPLASYSLMLGTECVPTPDS